MVISELKSGILLGNVGFSHPLPQQGTPWTEALVQGHWAFHQNPQGILTGMSYVGPRTNKEKKMARNMDIQGLSRLRFTPKQAFIRKK